MRSSSPKIEVSLSYSTACISDAQASNITDTFDSLLAAIISGGHKQIGELDLVSKHQKERLLTWNGTCPKAAGECVHHIIQSQALTQPHAVAIAFPGGHLTYGDLDQLSARLAQNLAALGIGPEMIVPLCFEKSVWAIVSVVAVVRAGGCFVFLDPSHPKARLDEIMSQIKASLIISSQQHSELASTFNIPCVVVNQMGIASLPSADPGFHFPSVQPENMLYVVFTSGSTGKPKGCIIEHRAFCTAVRENAVRSGKSAMSSDTRTLQHSAYSFDVSVWEILGTLMVGGCVCTATDEVSPAAIADLINMMNANWAFFTPSLAKVVKPTEVPSLRILVMGGEPLSRTDVETWAGHVRLVHGYGPSECTVAAVGNPDLTLHSNPKNIGHATGGVCWLVDPENHNQLAPLGAVGELLIEGPMLARGYLNAPEKDAAAFVDKPMWWPFWDTPQRAGRCYKTGDLVRYDSDGTLIFIGRKDNQTKLRGQRLEIGEIEHHLKWNKHVGHAIAVLPDTGIYKKRLVAVLSFDTSFASSRGSEVQIVDHTTDVKISAELKDIQIRLSKHLPEYMIPTVWITVKKIPLTTSGKIDRIRIREWVSNLDDDPYQATMGADSGSQGLKRRSASSAISAREEKLQEIFAKVLDLDIAKVTLHKSFIQLGGDSISAMQVLATCRAAGIKLTVTDVLRSEGVAELTHRAIHCRDSSTTDTFAPFCVSPMQRTYLPAESATECGPINKGLALIEYFDNNIPADKFALAIALTVERHPMLRARLGSQNGSWTQRITKETTGSYRFDSYEVPDEEQLRLVHERAFSCIDVVNGPVFVTALSRIEGRNQCLFLAAHRSVVDFSSWRIITQDIKNTVQNKPLPGAKQTAFQKWPGLQLGIVNHNSLPRHWWKPEELYDPTDQKSSREPNSDMAELNQGSIQLDTTTTDILFLQNSHLGLQSTPIDRIAAALALTFRETFPDCTMPIWYIQYSTRDEIENSFSGTVGCFDVAFPILDIETANDLFDIVRRVKDSRRQFPYGDRSFLMGSPPEQTQILLDCTALQWPGHRTWTIHEFPMTSPITAQGNLIDIKAEIKDGRLQLSFSYKRSMERHWDLISWFGRFKRSLEIFYTQLSEGRRKYCLSDFPLLSLTYSELDQLESGELLPVEGLTLDRVENIYPCSPIQEGLILSQMKSPGLYKSSFMFEIVHSSPTDVIRPEKIREAWNKVVSRHSSLRTIFITNTFRTGTYHQVVLKELDADTVCLKSSVVDRPALKKCLARSDPHDSCAPQHRLTIFPTERDNIFCQLEISHAIIDGVSVALMLRDLRLAYDGALSGSRANPHEAFIEYFSKEKQEKSINYWRNYLSGARPCYFPRLNSRESDRILRQVEISIPFHELDLATFLQRQNATIFNVAQLAWGLVLRDYVECDQVCFFYTTSMRDVDISGMQDAVGAFMNTNTCRIDFCPSVSIQGALQKVKSVFLDGLMHRTCSLAEIQNAVSIQGLPMCNTILTLLQDDEGEGDAKIPSTLIDCSLVDEFDPTEVI